MVHDTQSAQHAQSKEHNTYIVTSYIYIYSKILTETIICYRKALSTGSRSQRYFLESGIYSVCLLNIWSKLCLYNDVMLVMVFYLPGKNKMPLCTMKAENGNSDI